MFLLASSGANMSMMPLALQSKEIRVELVLPSLLLVVVLVVVVVVFPPLLRSQLVGRCCLVLVASQRHRAVFAQQAEMSRILVLVVSQCHRVAFAQQAATGRFLEVPERRLGNDRSSGHFRVREVAWQIVNTFPFLDGVTKG